MREGGGEGEGRDKEGGGTRREEGQGGRRGRKGEKVGEERRSSLLCDLDRPNNLVLTSTSISSLS